MCSVTLALTAASAAIGMVNQYNTGQQQIAAAQNAAGHTAQLEANEAAAKNQLAQNELAKGETEKSRFLRSASQAMGTRRSQLAGGNFELDSGSNASILSQEAEELQHDAQLISQRAAESAYGYQTQSTLASNRQSWAEYEKSKAKSKESSLLMGVGGSLLGSLGSNLNKVATFKSARSL